MQCQQSLIRRLALSVDLSGAVVVTSIKQRNGGHINSGHCAELSYLAPVVSMLSDGRHQYRILSSTPICKIAIWNHHPRACALRATHTVPASNGAGFGSLLDHPQLPNPTVTSCMISTTCFCIDAAELPWNAARSVREIINKDAWPIASGACPKA